ncbi:hypothetical protein L1280_000614 [Deinococcus sp. HSC-46F16]|uniref:hypothetical protein n=1 Tax=Deinococcus sp. HSC-46F16 TaxID=2910968 RepID=UPI0020A0229F|nr:hypothetical protein [Deinococcus sp. HSC-46F16]
MPTLPARVRVTRPPLPLAPALRAAAVRLCPQVPHEALTAAALAVAGGSVIGAALAWDGGEALSVESAWRGRGIEEALTQALEAARPSP